MEPKLCFMNSSSCLDKAFFVNPIKFLLSANTSPFHIVIICQQSRNHQTDRIHSQGYRIHSCHRHSVTVAQLVWFWSHRRRSSGKMGAGGGCRLEEEGDALILIPVTL